MKRYKSLLFLFFFLLFFSGCSKLNVSLDIHKDKSMDITILEIFYDKALKYSEEDIFSEEIENKIKEKGYEIEEYDQDEYKGYRVKKHINNIDEVSNEKPFVKDLGVLSDDNNAMFQIEEGIFSNKYIANIKFSDIVEIKEKIDKFVEEHSDIILNDYLNGREWSFEVKLPDEAKNTNALIKEDNNKKLTWNLLTFNDNIKFEFYLYNYANINKAIICIISIILFILIILIIRFIYNKIQRDKRLGKLNDKVEILPPIELNKPNKKEEEIEILIEEE